ncbi:uncharacterized protein LOC141904602 [Tubulanus polymorphus]|uniref:uncharacterized protein LOC141904602 n=1 Tax=Tubulanus polymorphus TaxID=672921 RepID=UPI003DA684DE
MSPTVSTAEARCLRFYYQSIYRGNPKNPGTFVGFRILRADNNREIAGYSEFPIVIKYQTWHLFEVTITDIKGVTPPYKVVIYFWWSPGQAGSKPGAGIDDISLLPGSCKQYAEMKYATQGNCDNKNPSCKAWSEKKECEKNPKYMLVNCPVSCGACVPCTDADKRCSTWAHQKECAKNPVYMLSQCPVSCHQCLHGCVDQTVDCGKWAKAGECSKNSKWMWVYCPRACRRCASGFLVPKVCKGESLLEGQGHTFTASSYSGKCLPRNVANNNVDCNQWCSAKNQARGSWVQVKFKGGAKVVNTVALWRTGHTYVVKEATYKYSVDGVHWYDVFHRGTQNKVFDVDSNYFSQQFKAVYIRMYPKLWTPHDKACARWAMEGCDAQDIEHEL